MTDSKLISFDLSPADFLNNMSVDETVEETEPLMVSSLKRPFTAEEPNNANTDAIKRSKFEDLPNELSSWPVIDPSAQVSSSGKSLDDFSASTHRLVDDDARASRQVRPGGSDVPAARLISENVSTQNLFDLSSTSSPPPPSFTLPHRFTEHMPASSALSPPPPPAFPPAPRWEAAATMPELATATAAAAASSHSVTGSDSVEKMADTVLQSLTGGGGGGVGGAAGGAADKTSSYLFNHMEGGEFQKTYELLVISNFIKLYPEMISDLNISRTHLAQYDDETRQKKFNLCKLYVLIQIESESARSLTSVFGLILRLVIYVLFPSGTTKTLETSLARILENTEKRTTTLFYFHAVSNLKKRNYEAPNIFYGYVTELLRMVAALVTEYMVTAIKA